MYQHLDVTTSRGRIHVSSYEKNPSTGSSGIQVWLDNRYILTLDIEDRIHALFNSEFEEPNENPMVRVLVHQTDENAPTDAITINI